MNSINFSALENPDLKTVTVASTTLSAVSLFFGPFPTVSIAALLFAVSTWTLHLRFEGRSLEAGSIIASDAIVTTAAIGDRARIRRLVIWKLAIGRFVLGRLVFGKLAYNVSPKEKNTYYTLS